MIGCAKLAGDTQHEQWREDFTHVIQRSSVNLQKAERSEVFVRELAAVCWW